MVHSFSCPRWFQLIKAHNETRGGKALTIPFLIGSLREDPGDISSMSPESAKNRIIDLLNRFLEHTPRDHVVKIYRCPELGGQPVANHFSSSDATLLKGVVLLEPNSQGRRTLVVSADFAPSGSVTISSLADQLYGDLYADICAARFSFIGGISGKYERFSSDNLAFIEFSKHL
jgi:hypothetical protein